MIDRNRDRSSNGHRSHAGQQTGDQQPAADHLRESRHIGQQNGEGQMQRTNESVCKIFDVGELLVTVMDQQRSGEHTEKQEAQVGRDGAGQDESDHRAEGVTDKS